MRITPLEPFGASVSDVALDALSDSAAEDVRAVVCRARVAVFRDQTLGDAAFASFLARLGETMFTDGETPVAHEPRLNVVTNVGRTRTPRSVFHTDTSYVGRPPAFTALRAVQVPDGGGETLFSDQVRAAADLPGWAWDRLDGRTVRHAYGTDTLAEASAWHPLLRRHPVTGETALYLSTPERCAQVSGFDDGLSARVITLLYRHSTRPARLYRHRWRAGDVVIWDDRLTLHKADHSAVVGARTFHRGMVRGEVPIMAEGMAGATKDMTHKKMALA